MLKLFDFKGEKIYFAYSRYNYGGGLAIMAFTEEGEPWGDISVNMPNLPSLGENEIIIPLYNVKDEYEKVFRDNFVEKEIAYVKIGFGDGVCVKLKNHFREFMEEL